MNSQQGILLPKIKRSSSSMKIDGADKAPGIAEDLLAADGYPERVKFIQRGGPCRLSMVQWIVP